MNELLRTKLFEIRDDLLDFRAGIQFLMHGTGLMLAEKMSGDHGVGLIHLWKLLDTRLEKADNSLEEIIKLPNDEPRE